MREFTVEHALKQSATGDTRRDTPSFILEQRLHRQGYTVVAGVDEAGRGPLAGPVVAAAVILHPARIPSGLDDSKRLTPGERDALFLELVDTAHVGFASAGVARIDAMNILQASLWAMGRAVLALTCNPRAVLVDGPYTPSGISCANYPVVRGDRVSCSIAAASIIAKVMRDRMMKRLAQAYPVYGFDRHKGYPTRWHKQALACHGPTIHHRRSFAPVRALCERH